MYTTYFKYDNRGRGDFIFLCNDSPVIAIPCRTGSIDKYGKLINAMPKRIWTGKEPPVLTTEPAMCVPGFIGWKYRWWDNEEWTHYCSHPDGNKPGSEGCPVSQKLHNEYYAMFVYIHCIAKQEKLILEVE
jgi:hypothetical protein